MINYRKLSRMQEILDEMTDNQFCAGANCLIIQNGAEQGYFQSGMGKKSLYQPIEKLRFMMQLENAGYTSYTRKLKSVLYHSLES